MAPGLSFLEARIVDAVRAFAFWGYGMELHS